MHAVYLLVFMILMPLISVIYPFEFPKSRMHFVVYLYLLVISLCSLWNGQRVIGHGLLFYGGSSGFHLSLLFRC